MCRNRFRTCTLFTSRICSVRILHHTRCECNFCVDLMKERVITRDFFIKSLFYRYLVMHRTWNMRHLCWRRFNVNEMRFVKRIRSHRCPHPLLSKSFIYLIRVSWYEYMLAYSLHAITFSSSNECFLSQSYSFVETFIDVICECQRYFSEHGNSVITGSLKKWFGILVGDEYSRLSGMTENII